MSNPNRLFIADYESLRKAIKTDTVNGLKAWLESPYNRNQDYIKSTLLKLLSIENNDHSSKGRGRRQKDEELSNDRYYSYNELERILCLCTFKAKEIYSVIETINMIANKKTNNSITANIKSTKTIEEYITDHSYSLRSSCNTSARTYDICDYLDLSEEDLFRLHTALFIARHSEPLLFPAWLITEKIKARSDRPDTFLEADDLILQYDTSGRIIDEPIVWTFIKAIKNGMDIIYTKNNKDLTDEPEEVVFNNSNGRIFLRFSSDHNLIGLDFISKVRPTASKRTDRKDNKISKADRLYLHFNNTGLSQEQLAEMFPNEKVCCNDDGSFKVSCQNYKDLKNFIRRYYKEFIPENKEICSELKNDCKEALKNYGVDI